MAVDEFGEDLVNKLRNFNDFYDDVPNLQIQCNKADDQLILEGQLRIYWGIIHPILFKEKDDSETASVPQQRHSYSPAVSSFDDKDMFSNFNIKDASWKNGTSDKADEGKVSHGAVVMRNSKKRRKTRNRYSIINGHLFSRETSLFKPVHGTVTGVTVTSQHTTQQVIKLLLDKFKVENHPIEFCLCVIRSSGETYALKDSDHPLLERIMLGPLEDEVKIFIWEKYRLIDINEEVAQFVNLPDAVLFGFLEKYNNDEQMEQELIRERYKIYREKLEEHLENISNV